MSAETRKARRHAAIARVKAAIHDRVAHAIRPLDEDDKDVARQLATALLLGVRDGYTDEERAAIEELIELWREARANTP